MFAVGTVNADFLMRVDAPPQEGASLIAHRLLRSSGGRAGNRAVMARRLGAPTRLFGCIGDDDLAEQAVEGPSVAGVDLEALRRVPRSTGVVTILVGEAGTKTMIMAPGANDAFTRRDGERLGEALRGAPIGTVLALDTELAPAAVEPAVETAHESGRITVLDPTRPCRVNDRLLEHSDHLTPNAEEAGRLTGFAVRCVSDAHRAARQLRERGPRHVHVRLPRGGCVTAWADGEARIHPPGNLDVLDTTGAGDAFVGTLAVALAEGRSTVDAARLAVAAAACAASGFGPQQSYPDRQLLDATARAVRVEILPLRDA